LAHYQMGVLIGALGLIFGNLFATPMKEFLPFLTIGLILWTLISTALNESCTGFTTADAMIKQISLPLFTHILRVLWRNLIIFAQTSSYSLLFYSCSGFLCGYGPFGHRGTCVVDAQLVLDGAAPWSVFAPAIVMCRKLSPIFYRFPFI